MPPTPPLSTSSSSGQPEEAGCLEEVSSLLESMVWGEVVEELSARFDQHLRANIRAMLNKDIYVTEVIRCAITPSELYPDARIVFKGGTSLAKAYPILRRFSEDVDVNVIPPHGQPFGDSRRKKIRKELHARLEAGIALPMTHTRRGTNFASTRIQYEPESQESQKSQESSDAAEIYQGYVIVEINIRSQPPDTWGVRNVTSLAGELVAQLDPSLLEQHPILKPFEVLTADPIVAVVDKLDALHWRSSSDDDPQQVSKRVRDIYDLACLLRHEAVRPRLSSALTAEMHEFVVASNPSGLAHRGIPRPVDGFASSPAFRAGHPANTALRAAYPRLRRLVYSQQDWIEFDDAIEVILSSSELI